MVMARCAVVFGLFVVGIIIIIATLSSRCFGKNRMLLLVVVVVYIGTADSNSRDASMTIQYTQEEQ